MTLYLWHLTVMVLLIGAANLAGGIGLDLAPGSTAWWATRPLWIGLLAVGLVPFLVLFGRFEQAARGAGPEWLPPWRAVVGSLALCAGLATLAMFGIGAEGVLGLRVGAVVAVLAGIALVIYRPTRDGTVGNGIR